MANKQITKLKEIENDKISLRTKKISLNPILSQIISTKTREGISTIVAKDNSGNFTSIKDAVDSGASRIIVKEGTYTIDENLILENQKIIGESRKKVILSISNSYIEFKETDNISTGGTIQLEKNDKTVEGSNTAFNRLDTDNAVKILNSDGKTWRIDSINDSNSLELKSRVFGQTTNPSTTSILQLTQNSFESRSNYGGIENLTINHSISSPKPTIIINGIGTRIKDVSFFNNNNLSTFIRIAKSSDDIAVNTLIENNFFEGGAQGIKINKGIQCKISSNYFVSMQDRCIEIFENSKYILINKNIFTSSENGIVQNAQNVKYLENTFTFIENKAISVNGKKLTTSNSFSIIAKNKFLECGVNTGSTYGIIVINGYGTIVSENVFDSSIQNFTLTGNNCIINECTGSIISNLSIAISGSGNIIHGFNIDGKIKEDVLGTTPEKNIFDLITTGLIEGNAIDDIAVKGVLSNAGIPLNSTFTSAEESIYHSSIINEGETFMRKKSILVDCTKITGFTEGADDSDNCSINFNNTENADSAIEIPSTADSMIVVGNLVDGISPEVIDNGTNSIVDKNYS